MADRMEKRHLYDAAVRGFRFLSTDVLYDEESRPYQLWYQKKSDELGDWSAGVILYAGPVGPEGPRGPVGPQGGRGENADVVPDLQFTAEDIFGGSLVITGTRPIAAVELYNADHSALVVTGRYEIRTCYPEGHTTIYFGDAAAPELVYGGRVRFAQGLTEKSLYQLWLDEGHAGSQTDFLEWMRQADHLYIAYARDALGAGFSLIPSEMLCYRAELVSARAYPTEELTAELFAGRWVRYLPEIAAEEAQIALLKRLSADGSGRLCLDGVPVCSGSVEPPEPSESGTMYYGYIPPAIAGSTVMVKDVTKDLLERAAGTIVSAPAAELEKTSLGEIPAGALVVVMLPSAAKLKAEKFDGISGRAEFSENNGMSGTGANGTAVKLEGADYVVYGEFKLSAAELLIYISKR